MSVIGKRHPPTANACVVVSTRYVERGPMIGDVVTICEVIGPGLVLVENATLREIQMRDAFGRGWAMSPEDLHPLDDGARAALDLVRS